MFASLVCLLVVLSVAYISAKEESLLDDSEYRKFVQFDDMLSSVVDGFKNASTNATTLDFANVAMMYHQRNQRWKQGGAAESLYYIDLALQSQSKEADPAHDDHKLHRSMLLHKAIMLTNLGQREASISVFDALLAMRTENNIDTKFTFAAIFDSIFVSSDIAQVISMNDKELSSILYNKAELLLTLYDDFSAAVSLFKEAVALYPCNYRTYLQLVHAMKATRSVTTEDWNEVIAEMEQYLLNVKQRAPNNKMKFKYKPPPIEYRIPFARSNSVEMDTAATTTVENVVHSMYNSIRAVVHPTTYVCTFSSTDSGDASDLYGATTTIGSSHTDTTLPSIYASLNWALFTAADSVPATSDAQIDAQYRNVAWKYLQQARHFDRQSINEQHLRIDYQQRMEKEHDNSDSNVLLDGVTTDNIHKTKSSDSDNGFIPTITSTGDTSVNSEHTATSTLGELAVRRMTDHSAAQAKHLTSFFKKGYWGKTEHYENYTSPSSLHSTVHSDPHVGTLHPQDESGSKTRIPIFIVGFFRSGSTLLESLLQSHSGYVRIPHNSKTSSCNSSGANTEQYNNTCNADNTTECELAAELGYRLHSVWGMGENSPFVFDMYAMQEVTLLAFDTLEKQRASLQVKYEKKKNSKSSKKREKEENKMEQAFMRSYNGIIDHTATTVVRKMKKSFADMHSNTSNNATASNNTASNTNTSLLPTHIVDKMLTNCVNIGLIHLVFPKAIILHTIRDPMDTLYSCYSTRFGDPEAVYTLHTDTLVQKYVQYLEVMQHFRKVLPFYTLPNWGLHNNNDVDSDTGTKSVHTDTTHAPHTTDTLPKRGKVRNGKRIQALVDVRYEELVANPERVLRYILNDILGISYIPSASQNTSGVGNNSSQCLSTEPITSNSTNPNTVCTNNIATRVVQTASRLQVKQPIYHSSVGRWLKYKHQLQQSLIPVWQQYIPYLTSLNALPYAHPDIFPTLKKSKKKDKCNEMGTDSESKRRECVFMNWNGSELYDYPKMLHGLM